MLQTVRSAAAVLTLALAGLAGGGCQSAGPSLPKTYPVTGQVVLKGGRPLTGGMVEFRSTADPALTTLGDIEPDGRFTLRTLFNGQALPGAVEGAHQVTVSPPRNRESHGGQAIGLPQSYTVEAKENHFVIEVELPAEK